MMTVVIHCSSRSVPILYLKYSITFNCGQTIMETGLSVKEAKYTPYKLFGFTPVVVSWNKVHTDSRSKSRGEIFPSKWKECTRLI